MKIPERKAKTICFYILISYLFFGAHVSLYAIEFPSLQGDTASTKTEDSKTNGPEGIVINGDRVEYSTDTNEATATGNIEIDYKGAKLTCQKLTINTRTKDALAEGNARLEDAKGIIEGEKLSYNFQTKSGIIMDANFRANPYFGRARKVEKVSDEEIIAQYGYITTCNFDKPHYRMLAKKIDVVPDEKIQIKDALVYVGKAPIMYMPQFTRSLKDPLMHVQVTPGTSKKWGPYMLTAYRFNLTDYINGRIYLDYRDYLGVAEGFGANYTTPGFGKGDFKYYYTQERNKSRDFPKEDVSAAKVFQRYMIRWRHKWDIDAGTNVISEYHKIIDSKHILYPDNPDYNFLREYFFREYEKDAKPLSYISGHHAFKYSTLDFLLQPRVNRWYDEWEKLPEIKYNFPNNKIGDTPFYFENFSQAASYNYKHAVPSPSSDDIDVSRLDTVNKFSLPMRVAFIQFTPFVKNEETYYTKDVYGKSTVLRTIFYSGADMSTKFYRVFNVKSKFLGLDVNGLRHVITPTIAYTYNRAPTVPSSKLRQVDGTDSISRNNSAALELSNKLQTKRNGQSVDLADFRINSNYYFKPKGGSGSYLSDVIFNLTFLPYSWLSLVADATYKHSGSHEDSNYNTFSNMNYDINLNLGEERTIGLGQRYVRKGSNEVVYQFKWRLNPKWKFSAYQRIEFGHGGSLKRGIKEEEYSVTRDLHCWEMNVNYNVTRGEGESICLSLG